MNVPRYAKRSFAAKPAETIQHRKPTKGKTHAANHIKTNTNLRRHGIGDLEKSGAYRGKRYP